MSAGSSRGAEAPAAGGDGAAPAPGPERCRNCDAPLSGPYCSSCGQHARGSARSMATLAREARDALVHLDGRLWRTLRALLLRPGFLTEEYFRERRASYVPPFRLYLAASLVFFSLAFVSGPRPRSSAPGEEERAEARREMEQAAAELRSTPGVPQAAILALEQAAKGTERAAAPAGAGPPPDRDAGAERDRVCQAIAVGDERIRAGLVEACRRTLGDEGRALGRSVAANVPRMMFVFLPLMALVMKGLYWRPRRYYVEHLVFFLQTHAAVFLLLAGALALESLVPRAPGMLRAAGLLASRVLWAYSAWYVWRALRVYYGQGRALTWAKFAAVGVAYVAFLSLTLLGTVIVSALAG